MYSDRLLVTWCVSMSVVIQRVGLMHISRHQSQHSWWFRSKFWPLFGLIKNIIIQWEGAPSRSIFFRQEACLTKQLLLAGRHWMLYKLWPIKSIHRCDGPDSICGPSFALIGQKLRPVSRSRQTDRQTNKPTNEHTCQFLRNFGK